MSTRMSQKVSKQVYHNSITAPLVFFIYSLPSLVHVNANTWHVSCLWFLLFPVFWRILDENKICVWGEAKSQKPWLTLSLTEKDEKDPRFAKILRSLNRIKEKIKGKANKAKGGDKIAFGAPVPVYDVDRRVPVVMPCSACPAAGYTDGSKPWYITHSWLFAYHGLRGSHTKAGWPLYGWIEHCSKRTPNEDSADGEVNESTAYVAPFHFHLHLPFPPFFPPLCHNFTPILLYFYPKVSFIR